MPWNQPGSGGDNGQDPWGNKRGQAEVGGGGGVMRRAAGMDATGETKDGGSPGGGDMLGGEVLGVIELGGGLTMTA